MNLNQRDQLLFDQFEETWVADPEVVAQARNNEFENFRLVFDRMFMAPSSAEWTTMKRSSNVSSTTQSSKTR